MTKVDIDSKTGLPVIPSGYRWRVGFSDRYEYMENHYAVVLEKLVERKTWLGLGRKFTWVTVQGEEITGERIPYTLKIQYPQLTKELISTAAISAYIQWQDSQVSRIKEADRHIRNKKFFGTYPPNSL